MKKLNIDWKAVGKHAKEVCSFVVCSTLVALPYMSANGMLDKIKYRGGVDYSDAVEAIMDSFMYSGDKTKVISALKKDETSEFYRAVIQVVNSSMYSGDKVKGILNMCGMTEE